MTQALDTNSVQANFDGVQLVSGGERFTLSRTNNEFFVAIEDLEAGAAPGNIPVKVPMQLVTGSHHMQVFWLPTGQGNAQMGFPFTWLIADRRWVPRHDAFIRDPSAPPSRELWNLTCIRCHVTAGQPRPNQEQGIFNTRVAELGIACEACHGPAEAHVKWERQLALAGSAKEKPAADHKIIQPKNLDHVRGSQVCGTCHSIKWFDSSEGWTQTGFRFRPGDDLEKTTPVVRPRRRAEQPWLDSVLAKTPDLFADFFWSDGMIRVAGREFNGLIESPCFQRGKMSCFSCHSMHQSDPDDQLARGMEGNRACLTCHEKINANVAGHTRHRPESTGSLCYNCHMPHTAYALLKAIRSHEIDSPSVASSLTTGRPNACNLCHLDQTLAWTGGYLTQWYGQPAASLSEVQRTTAASLLWLLSGDAGQRALVAWSYGWEPALQASGDFWQTPFLMELLADPYAAVRHVAFRSLRKTPALTGLNYDFVQPELTSRELEKLRVTWKAQGPVRDAHRILLRSDGTLDRDSVARLLQQRNNRSVRLRE
jgi:predicted CXXCH cytochrome family protein